VYAKRFVYVKQSDLYLNKRLILSYLILPFLIKNCVLLSLPVQKQLHKLQISLVNGTTKLKQTSTRKLIKKLIIGRLQSPEHGNNKVEHHDLGDKCVDAKQNWHQPVNCRTQIFFV